MRRSLSTVLWDKVKWHRECQPTRASVWSGFSKISEEKEATINRGIDKHLSNKNRCLTRTATIAPSLSSIQLHHSVCVCLCVCVTIAAVCVQGFLPALTCAVFCETHENIILLLLWFYSLNLFGGGKKEQEDSHSVDCST